MKDKSDGSMENKLKELYLLLVKQTAEITLKNRELEIEAALEKVCARSLAMKSVTI